ncbi:TPA: M20 family metallopeptidase [Thermoplasmata archaeon]|nr:M20 family metallopeptidase [Thermoplasmata archaeon]
MRARAEELLRELVLLKSAEEDDTAPVVKRVTDILSGFGLEPKLYGSKEKPAIFARSGKGGVVLSGHLDTVPIGKGWTKEQGEVADGRLYGRGAADMKAGCAAILLAAERLAPEGVPFSVCLSLDEEISMHGAQAVAGAHELRDAAAVVVAEPSNFDIIVREKGLIQFAVRTKGKSAHASMPHLGENAIARMLKMLRGLEDLQKIPDDPLEELTLCIDTIRGGTQVNVIPNGCQVEVDSRFPPSMTGEEVVAMVRERLGKSEYELEVLHLLEPVETDPSIEAVTRLHEIVGGSAEVLSVPYATEMVMFKHDNQRLMVCGPGEPTQAHVVDESVEIDQVARAVDVYVEYCKRMVEPGKD